MTGANWLTGWGYRKSHLIDAATGAGTNYQVAVKVYKTTGTDSTEAWSDNTAGKVYVGSNVRNDFGDIRFTADDGSTELSYYMEVLSSATYAIFWVKVAADLSTVNQTIYIYYGKSDATTTSNGANTFLDFNDLSSATGWTLSTQASIANGVLTITPNLAAAEFGYRTWGSPVADYKVRYSYWANTDNSAVLFGVRQDTPTEDMNVGWQKGRTYEYDHWYTNPNFWFITVGGQNSGAIVSSRDTTFHTVQYSKAGSAYRVIRDASTVQTATDATSETKDKIVFATLFTVYNGSATLDWYSICKYVSPEPAHDTWGNEETPTYDLTVHSNVVVDVTLDSADIGNTPVTATGQSAGTHTISVPATNGGNYAFDHWEDDSTDRTRDVDLEANTTYTATYLATLVLFDDDWVANGWVEYDGNTVSDAIDEVEHGVNSLKVVANAENLGIGLRYIYSNPIDISAYNHIQFYVYGNTGAKFNLFVEDNDGNFAFSPPFTDDSVGWKPILFSFSDLVPLINPVDYSIIKAIFIVETETPITGTVWFDYMTVSLLPMYGLDVILSKLYSLTVHSNVVVPIFLDGVNIGTTPITATGQTAGTHTIQAPANAGNYDFDHWEDASTDRIRIVDLEDDTTYTATFVLARGDLTVHSNVEVDVLLNNVDKGNTPVTVSSIAFETYTIEVPATITGYVFQKWEDDSTNPVRDVNFTGDTTYTATYGTLITYGLDTILLAESISYDLDVILGRRIIPPVLFDDNWVALGWYEDDDNTINDDSTTPYHGDNSIRVDAVTENGGIALYYGSFFVPIDISAYNAIQLWIRGNTGAQFRMYVYDTDDGYAVSPIFTDDDPSGWKLCTILYGVFVDMGDNPIDWSQITLIEIYEVTDIPITGTVWFDYMIVNNIPAAFYGLDTILLAESASYGLDVILYRPTVTYDLDTILSKLNVLTPPYGLDVILSTGAGPATYGLDTVLLTLPVLPIIVDDDWAEWLVPDPSSTNFSYTDDSIIQKHGSNCLKAEATGDNAVISFGHNYYNPIDLSPYSYISFWFYGVGNNDQWYFEIDDGSDPQDNVWYFFNDTTVGWKFITFKMSEPSAFFGTMDWSNIVDMWIWNNSGAGSIPSGTTYYFDYLIARNIPTYGLDGVLSNRSTSTYSLDTILAPQGPVVICDDDWAEYFTGYDGNSYSDVTSPKIHGVNALQITGTQPVNFSASPTPAVNLRGNRYIHFWFYGAAEMQMWEAIFADGSEVGTVMWTDDIIGWKEITLDTANFPLVNWNAITYIVIQMGGPESTFYFDYMIANNESDSEVQCSLDVILASNAVTEYALYDMDVLFKKLGIIANGTGNQIQNGDFESGVLSPWYPVIWIGNPAAEISTVRPHSGTYCAVATLGPAPFYSFQIKQDFSPPILVSSITEFTGWVRITEENNVWLEFFTEESGDYFAYPVTITGDNNWHQIDFKYWMGVAGVPSNEHLSTIFIANMAATMDMALDDVVLLSGGTMNMDALLEKLGLPITCSIDAILSNGVSPTKTEPYNIDTLLEKLGLTRNNSINVLFKRLGLIKANSIDILFKKLNLPETLEIDVLLKESGLIKTDSIDVLFKELGVTKGCSIDTLLKVLDITKTNETDVLLKKLGIIKADSTDVVLKKFGVKTTFLIDTFLRKSGLTKTDSIDALLEKLAIPLTANIDTILGEFHLKVTDSIDVMFQKFGVIKTDSIGILFKKLHIGGYTEYEHQDIAAGTIYGYVFGENWYAQTFTPTETHDVSLIKLFLQTTGNLAGKTFTVEIYATSGGLPTGLPLTSSGDSDASTMFAPFSWKTFEVSTITLTFGIMYAIVVHLNGGGNFYQEIMWQFNPTNPSSGRYCRSGDSGATWALGPSGYDFQFELWGVNPPYYGLSVVLKNP